MSRRIVLSRPDLELLRSILSAPSAASLRDRDHLVELREEMERAVIVEPGDLPADVVAIHARVQACDVDGDANLEYVLVPPSQADLGSGRLSVLAPLGTALLGYRVGDTVSWEMPGGLRHLRIQEVQQDPQANRPPPPLAA